MRYLYELYYSELFLYAYSLCRNEEQAKDLTSETFYRAFVSYTKKEEEIKYWLFRVLKNHYIDELRKTRWVTVENIEISVDDSPLFSLLRTEERRNLYEKILLLTEEYRELLVLYYFSGVSIRDISVMKGLTEPAAKMKLMRARKKLRGEMESEEKV